jgi:hypothetical protein
MQAGEDAIFLSPGAILIKGSSADPRLDGKSGSFPYGVISLVAALAVVIVISRLNEGPSRGILAVTIGVAMVVVLLFGAAEFDMSPKAHILAVRWLLPRKGEPSVKTAQALTQLFEAVFGDHHLSAYCFVRSAIASVTFLAIALIIIRWVLGATVVFNLGTWVSLALYACTVNVLGDYAALYVTRTMLKCYRKGWNIVKVVIVGFTGTIVVFVATLSLAIVIIYGVSALNGTLHYEDGRGFGGLVVGKIALALKQPYLEIYYPKSPDLLKPAGHRRLLYASFATTFVTGIWLWAALALSPVFRIIVWAGGTGLTVLGVIFEVHKSPFLALGYVGAVIVLGGGAGLWGVHQAAALIIKHLA